MAQIPTAMSPSIGLGDVALSLGPDLLQAFGSLIGGGEQRRFTRLQRKELEQLMKRLERGISPTEITSNIPRLTAAMTPYINQAFARGAARFGSRSGATLGAGLSAVNQAVSVPIAQQLSELPFFNRRILQQLAGIRASLAA